MRSCDDIYPGLEGCLLIGADRKAVTSEEKAARIKSASQFGGVSTANAKRSDIYQIPVDTPITLSADYVQSIRINLPTSLAIFRGAPR
jgi:hypothetical protein